MSTATVSPAARGAGSARLKVQRFGNFLSRMVMPNIGAFIAWGLITALFIPTGWLPNERLNELVSPAIIYLLPLLIAFQGGKMVYGARGGVVGAVATMGVIVGSGSIMLIGAMAMGPLAAWVLKKVESLWAGKVKPGMEMLVDNFALGIIGAILMILGMIVIEPILSGILAFLTVGVEFFVNNNLLWLTSVLVVPGQVLFLNNAINHGIMTPIGTAEVLETGKSLLFLVEANGGPWTGVALAFWLFGRGAMKRSAPGATLIMGLGGIAEVVFPYVLAKPMTILGPIAGYSAGMATLQLLGGGTVGPVSPGSIFALIALSPRGGIFPNLAGYAVGLAVACLVTGLLLKIGSQDPDDDEALEALQEATNSAVAGSAPTPPQTVSGVAFGSQEVRTIVFACDAGMGSSAMAESIMRNKLTKAGLVDVTVSHEAVSDLSQPADLFLTSAGLKERVEKTLSDRGITAPVIGLANILDNDAYSKIVTQIEQNNQGK